MIKKTSLLLFLLLLVSTKSYSQVEVKYSDIKQFDTEVEINMPQLDVSFKLPPNISFRVGDYMQNYPKTNTDKELYYYFGLKYFDTDSEVDFYFLKPNETAIGCELMATSSSEMVDEPWTEIKYIKDKKDIKNIKTDEDEGKVKYMTDEDFKNYMMEAIKKEKDPPFMKPIASINTDFGEFIGYTMTYYRENEIVDVSTYMCFKDGYTYTILIQRDVPPEEYKKYESILRSIRKKDLSKELEACPDSIKNKKYIDY